MRLSNIALAALLLAPAAGCKSKAASPSIEEEATPLVHSLRECQEASFAVQRRINPDKIQAAEAAIAACASEEGAVASVVSRNPYVPVPKLIANLRAQAKQHLLAKP